MGRRGEVRPSTASIYSHFPRGARGSRGEGRKGALSNFLAVTLHLPSQDCEALPWSFEILNPLPGAVVTEAVTYSRPAVPIARRKEFPGDRGRALRRQRSGYLCGF